MKNNLKKTIKLAYSGVLALILLAGFSNSAKSQKANYSGNWKVDSLKSNHGGFVSAVALKIEQTRDSISIKATVRTGRGEIHSFTEKLPLDGKTMTKTSGTTKSNLSIKWSGKTLVETSNFYESTHNTTYQATETWTLSPDNKTLTIDRVVANDGNGGHGTSKTVYNRE
jgi:hypothetical protein